MIFHPLVLIGILYIAAQIGVPLSCLIWPPGNLGGRAMQATPLRVVVFQDGDHWAAQCLEHDIGAQAETIDALIVRFNAVLHAELKESLDRQGAPLAHIAPAPERFQLMWHHRTRSVDMSPLSALVGIGGDQVELRPALVA